MNWNDAVWLYCERGTRTALEAEPLNAASSMIMLLVAMIAMWIYRKTPFAQKSADHTLLIALTLLTGLGALAFHLYANQWSELAHMLPLLIFMTVYLAFALNRFLEMPPGWTVLVVGVFVLISLAGLTMTCAVVDQSLQPLWSRTPDGASGATSCLNGTGGYIPFFVALAFLAFALRSRRHPATGSITAASLLFAAALVFHAIDHLYCQQLLFQGYATGTHFIWHILEALVLFLLLRAAMVHQNRLPVQEIIPPDPKNIKK